MLILKRANLNLVVLRKFAFSSISYFNGTEDFDLKEPGPEDCCQSGCACCVWDVYMQKLQQRNNQLASNVEGKQNVAARVLTPFEALELRLQNMKKTTTH